MLYIRRTGKHSKNGILKDRIILPFPVISLQQDLELGMRIGQANGNSTRWEWRRTGQGISGYRPVSLVAPSQVAVSWGSFFRALSAVGPFP